jgi:hypothetical protein
MAIIVPSVEDISGLKDLIKQLNNRVDELEKAVKGGVKPTPAEQLRMILIGPPGAGTCFLCFVLAQLRVEMQLRKETDLVEQERVPKPQRSRKSSAFAIW